jgi:Activator of Hsp90 ATPase homolog 1-like protein
VGGRAGSESRDRHRLAGRKPDSCQGFHHVWFENHGTVLRFQPNTFLQYTHLSSISRLPDKPENYTRIAFRLSPSDGGETSLNVELENFPTESILRHFDFYWRVTIEVLKQFIETSTGSKSAESEW